MPPATQSILGLVELAHSDPDDTAGINTNRIRHDAFGHRLNDWLRNNDQWSFLNDNRACVILRDIGSADELERAVERRLGIIDRPG